MSSSKETILAFDAYGTLLSTESIADQLSAHFGAEKAKSIATKWRLYQLEYTWRLNSMRNASPIHTIHTRC
jgi:2-haloacid dehalogenase